MIKDILNKTGEFKLANYNFLGQRPGFYEISALKKAIGEYISQLQYIGGRTHVECIRDIKSPINNFNIYGRIVHKKAKGCAYFTNF